MTHTSNTFRSESEEIPNVQGFSKVKATPLACLLEGEDVSEASKRRWRPRREPTIAQPGEIWCDHVLRQTQLRNGVQTKVVQVKQLGETQCN